MCSIVSSAADAPLGTSNGPEILWRDDNFTVYRETKNPVSTLGHIIILFNLHVPSLYALSSSDLPLLISIRDLAQRFLFSLRSSTPSTDELPTPVTTTMQVDSNFIPHVKQTFRIGFITPPFGNIKLSVTGHLHAHAYILPADRMGWFRSLAFSPVAWYAIDDLIAEIREESSNNRIRSGTSTRPIDSVPHAGARMGTADGVETTKRSLAVMSLEDGEHS